MVGHRTSDIIMVLTTSTPPKPCGRPPGSSSPTSNVGRDMSRSSRSGSSFSIASIAEFTDFACFNSQLPPRDLRNSAICRRFGSSSSTSKILGRSICLFCVDQNERISHERPEPPRLHEAKLDGAERRLPYCRGEFQETGSTLRTRPFVKRATVNLLAKIPQGLLTLVGHRPLVDLAQYLNRESLFA